MLCWKCIYFPTSKSSNGKKHTRAVLRFWGPALVVMMNPLDPLAHVGGQEATFKVRCGHDATIC
jgi:hypothetical protein